MCVACFTCVLHIYFFHLLYLYITFIIIIIIIFHGSHARRCPMHSVPTIFIVFCPLPFCIFGIYLSGITLLCHLPILCNVSHVYLYHSWSQPLCFWFFYCRPSLLGDQTATTYFSLFLVWDPLRWSTSSLFQHPNFLSPSYPQNPPIAIHLED